MDSYRLAPVRDLRTRAERVMRSDLAVAVGDARASAEDVAAAAGRAAVTRTALAAARDAHHALVAAGSSPPLLALADRFTQRRRRDLEAALGELARAEAAHAGRLDHIDAARGQFVRARAEREVIERHFARWRETQTKLAERRED